MFAGTVDMPGRQDTVTELVDWLEELADAVDLTGTDMTTDGAATTWDVAPLDNETPTEDGDKKIHTSPTFRR